MKTRKVVRASAMLERLYGLLERQLDTLEASKSSAHEKLVRCLGAATRTLEKLATLERRLITDDACTPSSEMIHERLKSRIREIIAQRPAKKSS